VLAPLVFAAAAAGDRVAQDIVEAFAEEVVVMVGALIRRLNLARTDVEVVLGGGTLQNGNGMVLDRVTAGILGRAPRAQVSVLTVAPVFGAVVEAFDRLGADGSALAGIRQALAPADVRQVLAGPRPLRRGVPEARRSVADPGPRRTPRR
jgi:N-acetylglucosamine kinase-like BadF-type ATPase